MRARHHFLLVIMLVLTGAGCVSGPVDVTKPSMEYTATRVSFPTSDGVVIVGDLYHGPKEGPAALLLHMMPATRESWSVFAGKLIDSGFGTVLAIDLRGHGESTSLPGGPTLDYLAFTDAQHQASIHDVEAATAWLHATHGVDTKRLAVVGASIGANLAITFAAAHPEIPAVVALSPGLDFHGVTTGDKVGRFDDAQTLELVASDDDPPSYQAVNVLGAVRSHTTVKKWSGAGHGTAMFAKPGVMDDVVVWLRGHVH